MRACFDGETGVGKYDRIYTYDKMGNRVNGGRKSGSFLDLFDGFSGTKKIRSKPRTTIAKRFRFPLSLAPPFI